ncbi:MAG: SUMF1/EgtB/PvdO family nonheme iron enzyme [Anaerolineales bacterium]|nr:SUMF1/EgtB/PvdO family nonheme iron enzyme [Anaerolineales bacterium]
MQAPLNRVSPQNSGEDFLKSIVNTSGLLVEREAGLYSFAHLTFQEYLAAVHVQDRRLENELLAQVENTWWHETIRLYAAQVDATNIVRACLNKRTPSIQALTLAMECLEEAREVQAELRNIFDRLAQSVDHPNQEVRRISAEVRLALRIRRMLRVDEDRYVDNSFVTHAEYQLFIDESRRFNRYYQPDHWKGYTFLPGDGRLPIVGIRPSDVLAYCEWMTDRDQGEWRYRLPRKNELELLASNSKVVETTDEPVGYWYTVSAQDFVCAKFNLAKVANVETLMNQIQDRFNDDWRLFARLPNQNQARKLIMSRVRYRQFTVLDLDRNLNLDRLQDPDIVRDVNIVRNRGTISRAQALKERVQYDLTLAQDPDLERARMLNLQEVLQVAKSLSSELDHAQNQEGAPELARMLLRGLERAESHAKNKQSVFQPELIRALTTAHGYASELVLALQEARSQARLRVRTNTILNISEILQQIESFQNGGTPPAREDALRLLESYIDLYLDFIILEARIVQKLPSFEGIRLIRERKQPVV